MLAKSCCLAWVGVYTPPPLPGLIRDTPCGHGANSRDLLFIYLFSRNKEKCTRFVGKTRLNDHPDDVVQRSLQKTPPLGNQEAAMLASYTALWTSWSGKWQVGSHCQGWDVRVHLELYSTHTPLSVACFDNAQLLVIAFLRDLATKAWLPIQRATLVFIFRMGWGTMEGRPILQREFRASSCYFGWCFQPARARRQTALAKGHCLRLWETVSTTQLVFLSIWLYWPITVSRQVINPPCSLNIGLRHGTK